MPSDERPPIPLADDLDAPGAPISVADSGETSDGGKLKMIVALLKKAFGVKDIAAMRLSLPASLLEPIPNLEYWQYLDRPDLFAGINDSEDPFERLLALLRFMFSKDIKFIHGKICKPYNSVLGEFFLSHWDVVPISYPSDDRTLPPIQHLYILSSESEEHKRTKLFSHSSPALSPRPSKPSKQSSMFSIHRAAVDRSAAPSPTISEVEQNLAAGMSDLSLATVSDSRSLIEEDSLSSIDSTRERVRVLFLTEQISHHPPISAYHYSVPTRGISASGVDQIAARVSGATVKVSPGVKNKGMFIKLDSGPGKGETYQITHPVASVNGILTGKFYATVSESSIVSITGGENWRVIVEYKDEGWLASPKFALEGVIHTIDPNSSAYLSWTRVKHVPEERILARLEGSWKAEIRWRRESDKEWKTLINLSNLASIPKIVRPLSEQLPHESRKLWEGVTSSLLKKEYSEATRIKQHIEQLQRDKAAMRKRKGETFTPAYFDPDIESGAPDLTDKGRAMLAEEDKSSSSGH